MITYKDMKITDIKDLAPMYVETFNSEPWNDKWTLESASKRLQQMINVEDFYGMCAYDEGTLCGMILGSKEQFYDGIMFNIKEFCIRNGMRGKGVGTMIFKEFEKTLKTQGVNEIILFTSRGDFTQHFYHKQGAHDIDELVFMGKEL